MNDLKYFLFKNNIKVLGNTFKRNKNLSVKEKLLILELTTNLINEEFIHFERILLTNLIY
jgi:hypothetical protein